MRPSLPLLAALLLPLGLPTVSFAGQQGQARAIVERASAGFSRIVGTVRDETGLAVPGVSVVAVGTTLAAAKSDVAGYFSMHVPAGEYVLRAARDGYVSTYREAVRVQGDVPIRRAITLLKSNVRLDLQPVAAGSGNAPGSVAIDPSIDVPDPSEVTWRLRHLPRSVLRERTGGWSGAEKNSRRGDTAMTFGEPFWAAFDLRGSVDLMTTSSVAVVAGDSIAGDFPRGVAYVVVGAPVGTRGDWIMRAALAADDASAWTFVGEYRARADRPHRIRTGVTYSAQTLSSDHGGPRRMALPDAVLRVGGLYGYDHWTFRNGLELSYGGRIDRFDYLAEPNLAGGSFRAAQKLAERASVFAAASRHMVAPGADQFQPPSVTGVWLPPDRTFSSLDMPEPIGAAEVDRYDVGATFSLLRRNPAENEDDLAVGVSRFIEQTQGQIATIFGLDQTSPVGHYHVGAIGHPRVDGVVVEVSGKFAANARGRVAYTSTSTLWGRADGNVFANVRRLGISRRNRRGHDLSTTFEGTLPVTDTRLHVTARVNDWFSAVDGGRPGLGTRFALELQQPLPIRALGREAVMLVIGARTLLGDGGTGRGFYDDLVTVDPPLRITCGIQMRF